MRPLLIHTIVFVQFLVLISNCHALDSDWKIIWESGTRSLEARKFVDALNDFNRAEEVASKIGKYSPELGVTFASLCEVHQNLGHSSVAEKYCGKAVAVMQVSDGKSHPNTIIAMSNLGEQFDTNGKYEDAEKVFLGALLLLMQNGDRESVLAQAILVNLAGTYKRNGKTQLARETYTALITILERLDESKPRIESVDSLKQRRDQLGTSPEKN
jgi:tetratricopeptide (TPR) repeat protein